MCTPQRRSLCFHHFKKSILMIVRFLTFVNPMVYGGYTGTWLQPTAMDTLPPPPNQNHGYATAPNWSKTLRLRHGLNHTWPTLTLLTTYRHEIPKLLQDNVLPRDVIVKIYSHSYKSFKDYAKKHIIQNYQPVCDIRNCFICKRNGIAPNA